MRAIHLNEDDLREGLALQRQYQEAMELAQVAQSQLSLYMQHLATLYRVPEGWTMTEWAGGFSPPPEEHNDG